MRYTLNEKKVLKKLGIEDFRHMTKDKIVQFASMLPKMDPEVAKKALEQFPEFKDMAIEVVKNLRENMAQAMESESHSQDVFTDACNKVIDSLERQLGREDITPEEEQHIRDDMIKVVEMMYDKDTEHKAFLLKVIKYTCASAAVIALAASSLLGVDIHGIGKHNDF